MSPRQVHCPALPAVETSLHFLPLWTPPSAQGVQLLSVSLLQLEVLLAVPSHQVEPLLPSLELRLPWRLLLLHVCNTSNTSIMSPDGRGGDLREILPAEVGGATH